MENFQTVKLKNGVENPQTHTQSTNNHTKIYHNQAKLFALSLTHIYLAYKKGKQGRGCGLPRARQKEKERGAYRGLPTERDKELERNKRELERWEEEAAEKERERERENQKTGEKIK
jgi:hypothetical protein